MARQRRAAQNKGDHYAWSDLYNGGEVKTIDVGPGGKQQRNVVVSRNVIRRGEMVSQSDLDVSDEEWEHLIATGSVRAYPLPDGSDDRTSPGRAFMQSVVDPDTGEIDMQKLMEMALTGGPMPVPPAPVMNPPASEAKEVPVGA